MRAGLAVQVVTLAVAPLLVEGILFSQYRSRYYETRPGRQHLASYLDVQGCFRRLVCESLFYGDRPAPRSATESLVLRAFGSPF
ncbi:hypothetical protein FJT64_022726 [Amphibalanus amphitrite]|uniref:Uncharacterized protein n=1 Tax=Amphibalanus amphitrite TaxID=1232801 RepID=A0A6A4VI13_AMPAM|nr:hypothetical protein FJT64_010659 [Amphibalanus amphitrite]KAF0305694.1 hypothetical protein FJT64_022726 [Amphibalanus amphitrite]